MTAVVSIATEDPSLSLMLAVIGASPAPLVLLDGELRAVAASASFCETFGVAPARILGSPFLELGDGEWNVPPLRSLLTATAAGAAAVDAYEMDLVRPGRAVRRLIVQARRLVYAPAAQPRLLVAVSDVTEIRATERAKDEALARNSILLQEVRHRVANSLQIIASVLLQTARRAQSEEARRHLKDAHSRVMSVAALERLLSGAPDAKDEVEIHAYFTHLCDSIAASMIGAGGQITLRVAEGPSAFAVPARVSISLGLIVTELVINALKHAFPEDRGGHITVRLEAQGPSWRLHVTDDGVGMPIAPERRDAGLGTSIVEALAKQLEATVTIDRLAPGTAVRIEHGAGWKTTTST